MAEQEEEYTVEAIKGWRYNYREKCRKEFFIKWLNYPDSQNTYEPEEHLNCPDLLNAFVQGLDPVQQKYFFSSDPRKLSGFQRNAKYLECIGADGRHESDEDTGDESLSQRPRKKSKKQKFYLLVKFDDSDMIEEVTLDEFFKYQPKEALAFFEARFAYEK